MKLSHLFNNPFVIVISQRSTQFIVVHAGSLFQPPPFSSHVFLSFDFELALFFPCPRYQRRVPLVFKKFEQKFP